MNRSKQYKPQYFESLRRLEENNFWFQTRNRLILLMISKYFLDAKSFLEIGCGTGYVLKGVKETYPQFVVAGGDIYGEALDIVSKRVRETYLIRFNALQLPFVQSFDVIGAFDLIEHIKDDEDVLRQINRACRDGGGIILTVPQHFFLWSRFDRESCHVRRYNAKELVEKVKRAGFHVIKITSFVSLLLPFMYISRKLWHRKHDFPYDALHEFHIPIWLNRMLKIVMDIERLIISVGINLPFGGSLILVAYKDNPDANPV